MKSTHQVITTTRQTSSESNFNTSRRRFLHAGTGAGLTAIAALFIPPSGWSLVGQAHAADVSPSSPVILDMSVSSRSGRVGFAKQKVTVLPFASFLWLAQQLHWRTRGLKILNTMPAIRELTPQQAQGIYNLLVLSYVGNALVAGSVWHERMREAISRHKVESAGPLIDPADVNPGGKTDTPTRPGDGLYPFEVNEALEAAASQGWNGSAPNAEAAALRKRLEDALKRQGTGLPNGDALSGMTPVINFWTGELTMFPGSGADGLLGAGYTGGNGGHVVDYSPSTDGDSDRGNAAAALGAIELGAATAIETAEGAALFELLLAAEIAATGVGLVVIALILWHRSSNEKDEQQKQKANPTPCCPNQIPSGTNDDEKPTRIQLPSTNQISLSYQKDFRNRRVGLERFEYDLSRTQNIAIAARQSFDQLKESMFWSLIWRDAVEENLAREDGTGLSYMKWLSDKLLSLYVPSGSDYYDPNHGELDTLGKPPSIPPRAVALTFDAQVPVMSSGTKDITVQIQVLR